MLCFPGFEGFANFSNLFGIISFAWESVDHARFCFSGDGVFGFHQGSPNDGRRLVYHFYFCGLGGVRLVLRRGRGCWELMSIVVCWPSWPSNHPAVLSVLKFPSAIGLEGFCVLLNAL